MTRLDYEKDYEKESRALVVERGGERAAPTGVAERQRRQQAQRGHEARRARERAGYPPREWFARPERRPAIVYDHLSYKWKTAREVLLAVGARKLPPSDEPMTLLGPKKGHAGGRVRHRALARALRILVAADLVLVDIRDGEVRYRRRPVEHLRGRPAQRR